MWEYKPEKIYKDDISLYEVPYWLTQEKLIPWLHYPNISNTIKPPKLWFLTISATWVLNVTWLWFTPVYIRFTWISWVSNSFIYGIMTATEQWTTRIARAWTMELPATTAVLRNTNSSDTLILQANNNWILSDWFSLNVTTCSSAHYFLYEAYY